MEITQSGSPSNIIWENMGISRKERCKRIFICLLIVFGMTAVAFSVITKLKIESS